MGNSWTISVPWDIHSILLLELHNIKQSRTCEHKWRLVGLLLDNTLDPMKDAADRGIPWWKKPFQDRNGEPTNEEFYCFPLNLDDFIPDTSRFFTWNP